MTSRSRLAAIAAQHGIDPADLAAHVSRGRARPLTTNQTPATTPTTKGPSMSSYHTPLVSKLAAELQVDLSAVTGTGAGGRVRADDVYAAAGRPRTPRAEPRRAAAAAPASFSRPRLMREHRSEFLRYVNVEIDAFALNPFLDDLRQTTPGEVEKATAHDRNVPTMFSAGDVPIFTASGFDPNLLLRLPWSVRHKAALSDNATEVAEIFERCGGGKIDDVYAAEMLGSGDEGLDQYKHRLEVWLNAPNVRPVPKALRMEDLNGQDHPSSDFWKSAVAGLEDGRWQATKP